MHIVIICNVSNFGKLKLHNSSNHMFADGIRPAVLAHTAIIDPSKLIGL